MSACFHVTFRGPLLTCLPVHHYLLSLGGKYCLKVIAQCKSPPFRLACQQRGNRGKVNALLKSIVVRSTQNAIPIIANANSTTSSSKDNNNIGQPSDEVTTAPLTTTTAAAAVTSDNDSISSNCGTIDDTDESNATTPIPNSGHGYRLPSAQSCIYRTTTPTPTHDDVFIKPKSIVALATAACVDNISCPILMSEPFQRQEQGQGLGLGQWQQGGAYNWGHRFNNHYPHVYAGSRTTNVTSSSSSCPDNKMAMHQLLSQPATELKMLLSTLSAKRSYLELGALTVEPQLKKHQHLTNFNSYYC